MRRFLVLLGVLIASCACASGAGAATTPGTVSATFAEPIMPAIQSGCPIPPNQGLCGSGELIPFGHATETILFGGACGGDCDLRTINLADGSIVSNEVFSNPTCPGVCASRGFGQPAFGTVTDVIVGGTGSFAGASGHLAGSVHAAGTSGVAQLSGTITLAT